MRSFPIVSHTLLTPPVRDRPVDPRPAPPVPADSEPAFSQVTAAMSGHTPGREFCAGAMH
ncbi:hypothetical protein SCA03_26580 [Streptomyces cacaoi]|uniref:Uncharacterized protein n=1 Tax=Streptomyces cacaoi TaxID=1898 RepID=A0A4Y3QZN3_STRCI|nr:hypothetical protein SCA03_26580 [Streptomyces cacaoi]